MESHENLPHERFCHDVLRIAIEALNAKNLPEQVNIEFPPSCEKMPAWMINANIRPERNPTGGLLGFNIRFPELLPTMSLLFAHLVAKQLHLNFHEPPSEDILESIRKRIQRFLDVSNVGIREYRNSGLASAIRAIYETGGIAFLDVQEAVDDFDSICQFIANHEIAHAYIGQLHAVRASSENESKSFEFVADLLSTRWLFNHFVLNTPDSEEYREMRGLGSHAESLETNVLWLARTHLCVAILMALATGQKTGKVSLQSGITHPSSLGRYHIQMLWLLALTSGYLEKILGEECLDRLQRACTNSTAVVAGTVATRSNLVEMLSPPEIGALNHAARIIEKLDLVEVEHAASFIKHLKDQVDKKNPLA